MVNLIFNGTVGFVLLDLAFVGALLAMLALWQAQRTADPIRRKGYERIGHTAFVVHGASVLGIMILILGLIFFRQYQYHYAWSHSSNELPVYYMVACLWEGQEGSFLIWMLWHSVLGVVLMRTNPQWRNGVIMVVAAVELVLTTMVLGIGLPEHLVFVLLTLTLLGLLYYLLKQTHQRIVAQPASTRLLRSVQVGGALLVMLLGLNLWRGQTGFWNGGGWKQPAYALETLLGLAFVALSIWSYRKKQLPFGAFAAAITLATLGAAFGWAHVGGWDIGSSPFILLRDALPDADAFKEDPNFVPLNGTGLNPLLQNYWMVIHPPTLFLGFAATLIPFAFAVAGLLSSDYGGWVRQATPWAIFSVLILGVGIMMGGYWAYETLNFGGYWNWDPVENASFVPWLTGVASLHTLLSFRRSGAHLRTTIILLAVTFVLVLYSTFLTRSGILGDSSVHSFTDLGLSGQLLVLLLLFTLGVSLLIADRWPRLPRTPENSQGFWTRENFLFLAAVTLVVMSVQISFATSLPVFNAIFGTKLAPPANVQLFYYKWNVWFGIAIAVLSGVGQFFFWTKVERRQLAEALFRPFLMAVLSTIVVLGLIAWFRWQFVFTDDFDARLQLAQANGGAWATIKAYISYGLLMSADEILLACSLFVVLANGDILWRLVRRSRANLRNAGGALSHIGIGLLMLGALFSSGYEYVVSVNNKPSELGAEFPTESRNDNVLLVRNQPRILKDYYVTYKGKRTAQRPISELTIVTRDEHGMKVSFTDATGLRFAKDLPAAFYRQMLGLTPQPGEKEDILPPDAELDLDALRDVMDANLELVRPQPINGRALYTVEFMKMTEQGVPDSSTTFVLYPEAEVSDNMGLIAHPDRKVGALGDLYVHVTSIPAEPEGDEPERNFVEKDLHLGDSIRLERSTLVLENVVRATEGPDLEKYDLVALAKIRLLPHDGGPALQAEPPFFIADNNADWRFVYVPELGTALALVGAKPDQQTFTLQVAEEKEKPDYITLKALHKPYINVLWFGFLLMMAGFVVALVRRIRDQKPSARKPTEAQATE